MSNYLQTLTTRLVAGTAQLSDAERARHMAYVAGRQNADGGFSGREGPSDLYYTAFALRALAIGGALAGDVATGAADYLRGRLTSQAPIVDFLSLLYGAALLEAAGCDVFDGAVDGWRHAVAAALEGFRRDDGGYARTEESGTGSTYHTFLVVLCLQLIDAPLVDAKRIEQFVLSRRREDGGFVEISPMTRSGTNPTAAAIALLKILDAVSEPIRASAANFLAAMQNAEGGLRANTRIPLADLLSTFTGALSLADLGSREAIDIDAARRYVKSLAISEGGFRGGAWDQAADVEYTFYGLASLAVLGD